MELAMVHMSDPLQATYLKLILESTGKCAAWDPEEPVRVGDYGQIHDSASAPTRLFRRRGRRQTFVKYGNIYDDKHLPAQIPEPREYGKEADGGFCGNCILPFTYNQEYGSILCIVTAAKTSFYCTKNTELVHVLQEANQ